VGINTRYRVGIVAWLSSPPRPWFPLHLPPIIELMVRRRLWIPILTVAVLASLTAAATKSKSKNLPTAPEGSAALEHVRYLSADARGGRGNGTPGLEDAARYIAKEFERYGLEPAGDKGYFQPFSISLGAALGPANALRTLGKNPRTFELHRDYEPLGFSGSGKVEASVVFAGYGITAPDKNYDDYAGVSVRGKIVLVLRHHPREGQATGPFEKSTLASFVSKAVNAKSHGAAALVVVNDPLPHHGEPDELVKFAEDLGAEHLAIPALFLKRVHAETLLAGAGKSLEETQAAIDRDLRPQSFLLDDVRLSLSVDVQRTRGEVRNVLGYVPPAGATGGEEIIVIGGHYDHLGLGHRFSTAPEARGQIHNGADDNASGTAGVIELARLFAANRERLTRGVLFVSFAGEELGLLGSTYYVNHPFRPLEKTVAMLNLDMIGRLNDTLYVGGAGTSPVFRPKLDELGAAEKLAFSFSFSGNGSSDHTSFLLKEIPSLFFFTGLHADYHKPTDDWEKVDAAGEERVLRIVYGVADYLQSLPERPPFDASAPMDRPMEGAGSGYGAYFGSVPDFAFEGPGVRFSDVTRESPAARAGLQAGDVLVAIDGSTIDTLHDFTDALRRRKPGDVISVTVARGTERIDVSVTLGRRP